MRILFVNPSLRPNAPHRYLPVGLGYVVTAVKRRGFKFDILDLDATTHCEESVETYLSKKTYDVILVGSIVSHYRWIKWFLHTARRLQPRCTLVVGNSVGSSMPEILFAHTPADVVVLGEGDITTVEVLEALRDGRALGEIVEPIETIPHHNGNLPGCCKGRGIFGIVFRDSRGRLVHTGLRPAVKKIDDLPWPDWDLFDVEYYIDRSRGTAHPNVTRYAPEQAVVLPVNTARGCVHKCTFCHYVFWDDPYRHRSAGSVIAEIDHLKKKYGANFIHFWDELSFHKLAPAERFLDTMIEADLGVHWSASVRADLMGRPEDAEEDCLRLAHKFKEAGAVVLAFSLESGSAEILADMNKHVEPDYFRRQAKILTSAGLISSTSLIFGYPRETRETIAKTMSMCEELNIYPSSGFLLPLPGTGVWRHAMTHRYITDADEFLTRVTERQDLVLNMTRMSDADLVGEVTDWLRHLNKVLGNGLDEASLLKTGGGARHDKNQKNARQG